jgi:hypothetical protein
MTRPIPNRLPAARRGLAAAALLAAAGVAGCKGLLDVENPNNVIEENISTVAAAPPLANGVLAITVRAFNAVLDPFSTASDELDFVGSQDGFFQLDVGNLSNPAIQFSNNGFTRIAEARWMGDEALKRFAAWEKEGTLTNANLADRATAYLYTAVTYATIGDMFDDFALSDRQTAAQPIGEQNMRVVYDTAVAYLDRGLATAQAANNLALRQQILATRARVKHGRALWAKLNPPQRYTGTPAPIANPLVNDEGANADARAALALVGTSDWTFTVQPSTQGTAGNNLGNDLNIRREMRIGQAYAQPDPTAQGQNRTRVVDGQPVIVLNDPVTGQPDLALRARVNAIITGGEFLPMTLTSARELHLILAEAALAAGDAAEARTRINTVRAFVAGTPAWDGATPDGLTVLRHMRRVHLFLMGRRLADMYRFGERDPRWQTSSAAFRARGCFFPITFTERLSNQNVTASPVCEGL